MIKEDPSKRNNTENDDSQVYDDSSKVHGSSQVYDDSSKVHGSSQVYDDSSKVHGVARSTTTAARSTE